MSEMVTITDIARSLGISASTVSRALNGSRMVTADVRGKVEKAALDLGFQKRSTRRHRGRAILNIKLVLPRYRNPELGLFFDFSALIRGLETGFDLCEINILCEISGPDYDPFPHKKGGDIDAFVFAFQQPPAKALVKLREQGTPFVVLNRSIQDFPCVASDHETGMEDLLDHLLEQRRDLRPKFVSLEGLGQISSERLHGLSMACRKRGLVFDPHHHVKVFPDIASIDQTGVAEMAHGFNALVCVNDIVAAVILTELVRARIKVPEEVMVTGFDDSPARRLSRPSLTTISMPAEELARRAATGLQLQILENQEPELLSRMKGNLLVGESTVSLAHKPV